jgi:hypothetical protein
MSSRIWLVRFSKSGCGLSATRPLESGSGDRFTHLCGMALSMHDYLDRADDEVLAVTTIEHVEAVRHIHEIVSTPDSTSR